MELKETQPEGKVKAWAIGVDYEYGHYEFLVMSFGITNAAATFMYLMKRVCRPFLASVSLSSSMILIYSMNQEDDAAQLRLVPETRRQEKLFAKFSKCELWNREVQFLDHVINEKGTQINPEKIKAVMKWEALKNPNKIRSGFGWILSMIYLGLLKISSSLTKLTQKIVRC
jgi:hypothetical protein